MATGLIGGVCAVVLLSGTAIAATGGNLIIGRKNFASTKTALFNPNGTALELGAHGAYPPILVGRNRNRVPHLNVDLIDGIDSSQFQRADVRHVAVYVEELAEGFGAAFCPPGTLPISGGFDLPDGVKATLVASFGFEDEEDGNGWYVELVGDETYDGSGVVAVTCYSPRGSFGVGASELADMSQMRRTRD